MAQLDALAFEGATKRSKPNLKVSNPQGLIGLTAHVYAQDGVCVRYMIRDRDQHGT